MTVKILGLAIGLAASLLMLLYIYQQLSFDSFHKNRESLYQLIIEMRREGITQNLAVGTAEMGVSLLEELPEVEGMARLSMPGEVYVQWNNQVKMVSDIQYADSSVLTLFSFELIRGNFESALDEPFTIVLTQSCARNIFGDTDPMNKVLKINGKDDYLVTGVMKDPPANSHLKFTALASFSTLYRLEGYFLDWDGGWGYYTYLKMVDHFDMEKFLAKLPAFLEKHINYKYRNAGVELVFKLDRLRDVYLFSSAPEHQPVSGNVANLYIFGVVALFILLIVGINFMNLSTARYSTRAREVGVRKTFGASRSSLVLQFLTESVFLSLIALILALLIAELALPAFSDLFDTGLSFADVPLWILLPSLVLLALIVGIFAGSYPAFYLSSFESDKVIRGNMLISGKGKWFRNLLVTGQFMISAMLIISTIGVYRQLKYMNSKNLGFDKEHVLVLDLMSEKSQEAVEILKNRLKQFPFIQNVSASSNVPVWGLTSNGYVPDGMQSSMLISLLEVDEDWLATMKINLVEGRNFYRAIESDQNNFIINQALAGKLGWDDPIGKNISRDGKHQVIGVVKDFHFTPLHNPIQPLIISFSPTDDLYNLNIRLLPGHQQSLQEIERIWQEVIPGEPFVFHFLDDLLISTYEQEERFGAGFIWFALLAIFLACMGLYALSLFLVLQRRMEIGIRKTFGADAGQIVWLLGKEYIKLVFAGNLIAFLLSWWFIGNWLENFAYRVPPAWWPFAVTLLVTLAIAIITVAWQSIKAANQNPVDAIRYE